MTLTGMITLVLIGRLGASAIAVVGISNVLMYNTWALFAGINESINYLVSQNFGERTMAQGNQRMQVGLVVTAALAALWVVVSLTLPGLILHWVGASPTLVAAGTGYLRIRMLSFAFSMFSNLFYAYMRAVGDTRTPMVISMSTNVLLIGLTYVLTYGAGPVHGMGLVGASTSMLMTEGLGLAASALVYFGPYGHRYATRVRHAWTRPVFGLVLRESAKLSLTELSMSLGMLVFTACITRLGTDAVAANEIALNILSFGFMPANGFAAAATILVGQGIGARQPLEARRGGIWTLGCGLVFMALFSIYLWLFALPVAKIYSSVPAVYTLAVSLIHIASFIQLFDGGGIILSGGLRGVGDTNFLTRVSLIVNWAVFIPLTILLTVVLGLGQAGAWLALCTELVLLGVCNFIRYLRLPWPHLATRTAGSEAARSRPGAPAAG
ncbi:MAG: MATE family efflux transporter [Alicyclobacillus sp.]|nr:MATE family efflux transporter [Alicyclobacillus sp.]